MGDRYPRPLPPVCPGVSLPPSIGLLVAACALALYAWTAAPTITWGGGDSAKLAVWVHGVQMGHSSESHPLYVALGWIFASLPLGGDLPYRLNLFSGFCGALAVYAMFVLCRHLTGSSFAAACASSALALSHTFWLHSVITEVYALHLLLLLSSLASAIRWSLGGADRHLRLGALFFGAGVANHLLTVWALPGLACLVLSQRGRIRPRLLLGAAIAAGLGAGPLFYALVKAASQHGLMTSLRDAAGLGSSAYLVFHPQRLPQYLAYLFYQFPLVGFLLGWVGYGRLFTQDRRTGLALALVSVPYLLFPLIWDFRDHYQFALSFYACFAIAIAPGVMAMRRRLSARWFEILTACLLLALPPCLYAAAPGLSWLLGVDVVRARTLPHRDNARYFLWPPKRGDDGASRYGAEALSALSPNAVIVGDYTPAMVLIYLQKVEGLRPDVDIRDPATVDEQLRIIQDRIDHQAVYVAALEDRTDLPPHLYLTRNALPPGLLAVPAPPVYRIVRSSPRGPGAGPPPSAPPGG